MSKHIHNTPAATSTSVPAATPPVQPLANINGVNAYEHTVLTWKVTANPKRASGKAAARFAGYMPAKTVGEYLSLGGTKADLRYDCAKGYVSLV